MDKGGRIVSFVLFGGPMAGRGSKPGERRGGRQKGSRNKITVELKAMILGALDKAGGEEYLVRQANQNPTAFLTLLGKVLPLTLRGDRQNPLPVNVSWEQERAEAIAAIDRAFREPRPDPIVAKPPAIEPRAAEGETPLPRNFAREGRVEPEPALRPVRHRAPPSVGAWSG
jgi:hypothetical protein